MPRGQPQPIVVLVRDDDGAELSSWPLACGRPGLEVIDRLAGAQLAARRLGCSIQLRHPCDQLRALIDLAGLREVLGQPEEREEDGIDEVVVPDDPVT